MKKYKITLEDAKGIYEGIFEAKSERLAFKKAKKKLHIYGDCEMRLEAFIKN